MLPGALSPTGQPQLDVDFVRLELHRKSSLMMWEGPFNASLALLATANQILTPPNVSHVPRAPQPACMEAQDALRAMRETINQMRLRPLASRAALPEQHSCWVHHLWQIAFAKKGRSRNFPHAWSVMSKACIAREVALLRELEAADGTTDLKIPFVKKGFFSKLHLLQPVLGSITFSYRMRLSLLLCSCFVASKAIQKSLLTPTDALRNSFAPVAPQVFALETAKA